MVQKKNNSSVQQIDDVMVTTDERILREIHNLYTDVKDGLVTIARDLDIEIIAPRKKINIMLIGNHSAGKSSFINWYVEESVQRTGVAIETQGFTLVTSGKKRESLLGNATIHLYPQVKHMPNVKDSIEYVNTEISTSKQKQFSLVTFIDTPGLVDGDMKYPFDVNNAILWFGNISDLIFVFFDPIGQALCKRTLNIVEKLNDKHGNKIKFFLSKADEAGSDTDRQVLTDELSISSLN
jgi:GTPase SAR1 family protein